MRSFLLGLVLAVAASSPASADPPSFRAGVARITVQDVEPFDALVWYPTEAPEIAWQAGPFTIEASRDAAIATGARFPVVLLSHGSGGSPLGHRDLAMGLARDGFIVVAPTHIADSPGRAEGRRA